MLAYLLHVANSDPWFRDRFYAMKARILRRYATPDGHDLQEIPGKECWSCYGSGAYVHYSGDEDTCRKCDGIGWYRQPRWTKLQRWKLGRYSFHEPIGSGYGLAPLRDWNTPGARNVILGYVRHRDYTTRRVLLATLLLALIFDRELARLIFPELIDRLTIGYPKLQRFNHRRCAICRRGWRWHRGNYYVCSKCANDPDVPF